MRERDVIERLSRYYFPNFCFPNVYFAGCEMDFAMVTKAGYLYEFEVKLSLADWRGDIRKDKWCKPLLVERRQQEVSRMFYVVPQELVDKVPPFVPQSTGIIGIDTYFNFARQAKRNTNARKLTDRDMVNLLTSTYYRYWTERRKRIRYEIDVKGLRKKMAEYDRQKL